MLSRVKIQNFKSIGEPGVDLELKPLTFLVGPNGGGKSSILDAIAFASRRGVSSELFDFSSIEDLHFEHKANTLSVQVDFDATPSGEIGAYKLSHESEIKQDFLLSDLNDIEAEHRIDWFFSGNVFPIRAARGSVNEAERYHGARWVGAHGENSLEILSKLSNANFRAKRAKIQKWASVLGMPDVAAIPADSEAISGSYADSQLDASLNLYLAGSGSRQLLPVTVQLFWAEQGAIIMIEEPEISLHPQTQIDVMKMFSEALKENKQIIATTHSIFMMQGIGYAVIKGWLNHEQIAVYHIDKRKEAGTVAKRLALSEKGAINGWIPSFAKVERKLVREWIKTLPEE